MQRFPNDPADILKALNQAHVKYLVVGGVAVIFHGVPRTTFDTDLAVELDPGNLKRFEHVMTQLGFSSKVPVSVTGLADPRLRKEWTQQKNMKVFSFVENRKPFRMVDVMVQPLKGFERLYQEKKVVHHQGVRVPLMPLTALMIMKRAAGRIQDIQDVEYLEVVQEKTRLSRVRR